MTHSIIMVDDDPHLCQLMEFACSAIPDARFLGISDPEAAVDTLCQEPPDVLICDVMMPGLSGPEVVEAFRRKVPDSRAKVVFLTAKIDNQTTRKLEAIATRIWHKPVALRAAVEEIRDLLDDAAA